MNIPTVGTEPIRDTAKTSSGAQRAIRNRRLMFGAFPLVASLLIGAAWWLAGNGAVPWAPTEPSTAQEPPVVSPPRVSVQAADSAAMAASQPSPRVPVNEQPADMHADHLARLMQARDELLQADHDTALRLDRIESELTGLRQQIETRMAAGALAPKKPRTILSLPPLARSTKPTSQTPDPPRVLSVDTWNGRPSVSILVGADVRFIAEGDVVGSAYVKRADPANQRVDFVPTGSAAVTAMSTVGDKR